MVAARLQPHYGGAGGDGGGVDSTIVTSAGQISLNPDLPATASSPQPNPAASSEPEKEHKKDKLLNSQTKGPCQLFRGSIL